MKKVLITAALPGDVDKLLGQNGFNVEIFPGDRQITKSELQLHIRDKAALISLLSDPVDRDVIESSPQLEIIANYAVGYNNIDIKAAADRGIIITNTPDVLTEATAELAVALTFACMRHLPASENFLRRGKFRGWRPDLFTGLGLSGRQVGIVGAGRIGRSYASKMQALGCRIIYSSRSRNLSFERATGATFTSLDELFSKSDIVSLHIPLNNDTRDLIGSKYLSMLKNDAILINTARGEILDEEFLIKILKNKKIFAAGLDVYRNEPDINPEFLNLENVILLPHTGSATKEARTEMALLAAKNVINVLNGRTPVTQVL